MPKLNKPKMFFEEHIKSLNILFENCELYTIPYRFIESFELGDISLSLSNFFSNLSCKKACVVFSEEGLQKDFSNWRDGVSLGQRLSHLDVVAIELSYENGLDVLVYVPWEDNGTDETTNSLMYFKNKKTICIIDASVAQ